MWALFGIHYYFIQYYYYLEMHNHLAPDVFVIGEVMPTGLATKLLKCAGTVPRRPICFIEFLWWQEVTASSLHIIILIIMQCFCLLVMATPPCFLHLCYVFINRNRKKYMSPLYIFFSHQHKHLKKYIF